MRRSRIPTRLTLKFLVDVILWTAMTPLAIWLRFDGRIPAELAGTILAFTLLSLIAKLTAVLWSALPNQTWRRVSLPDTQRIIYVAIGVMAVQYLAMMLFQSIFPVPRSIPILDFTLSVLALTGSRVAFRWWHDRRLAGSSSGPLQRVIVIGAGEAGSLVARETARHPELNIRVVGFLDDGLDKRNLYVAGIPVLGPIDVLPELVPGEDFDEVILAIPTSTGDVVRRVRKLTDEAGVRLRVMPGMFELLGDQVSVSRLREVRIEDLLRREPVPIDLNAVRDYVEGKIVLVTGAGGSIGSELVRQIIQCKASKIIALGRGENSIYALQEELISAGTAGNVVPIITDVKDVHSLERTFEAHRPDVVFHAAAHKHVPLMEANPEQAVLNNLGGTRNVVQLARKYGVRRLVNISTDKAVNPTSIMGATKLLAEQVVREASDESHRYVSVRFGNVLGSRGSVVPKFQSQIAAGGPVRVTHPDMIRYFMTIPEAVQLVLQAGAFAEAKAIYFLDMGEPVKIAQLAEDLILLSGLTPHVDIQITFDGVRPGEKLYEELVMHGASEAGTPHPKIRRTETTSTDVDIDNLLESASLEASSITRSKIREFIKDS